MLEPNHRTSKNRKRPPWGDILDGKPIELWEWRDESLDGWKGKWFVPVDTAGEQRRRMEQIKDHYDASDFYDLALILASQRDVSLTVAPPQKVHRTTEKWTADSGGAAFVAWVEPLRTAGWSWPQILDDLRNQDLPSDEFYQRMTPAILRNRYRDAKRYLAQRTKPKQY